MTNKNEFTETRESPLHQVHYARLAFDEALFTSSNKARGYENATALSAHARWTISATPTRNLTQNHEELQAPDRPLDETLSNQKDREDLDRLGLIASFLRMLPFTLDRTHFPHWVTQVCLS